MVARIDPASAARIQPRDEKRLVRALEVYFLTGRSLTDHFADTASPLEGYDVVTFALRLSPEETARRVADRVDQQFRNGLVDEIRSVLKAGVPEDAHPFGGLVYRQALEYLHGVRDEQATRALIAQENRRYARRQLIWFRKEPNLRWIRTPGEHPDALREVLAALGCSALVSVAVTRAIPISRVDQRRPSDTQMATHDDGPATGSNLQDVFLNGARRERLRVVIRLMDGTELEGRIKSFDRFALLVEHDSSDVMLFKHAVASIRPFGSVDG